MVVNSDPLGLVRHHTSQQQMQLSRGVDQFGFRDVRVFEDEKYICIIPERLTIQFMRVWVKRVGSAKPRMRLHDL